MFVRFEPGLDAFGTTYYHWMGGVSDQNDFPRLVYPVFDEVSRNVLHSPGFFHCVECAPNPGIIKGVMDVVVSRKYWISYSAEDMHLSSHPLKLMFSVGIISSHPSGTSSGSFSSLSGQ